MPILYTPIPTRKVHISSVLAPAQLTTRLDSLMNALNFFAYASFKENMRKFWFYILEMIPILIIAYYLYNDHDSAVLAMGATINVVLTFLWYASKTWGLIWLHTKEMIHNCLRDFLQIN
ncbi:hypothetical protein SERLADRAFT_432084 [Serpula lacrymans var. lacrymans S7.9]|uniref:Uncharacterized protein n=1 Tax=Serpula lacrymans var. lacrymans (strain S7.9) TaxID=578457 RepID=F8NDY6_SERL9|nr:uncharacterized protein SERLADRAFT_432084 [Serpula lacrymans var. lacrymans S7.9]EGO30514.1 hypothetical protein SERLADRAFT_432084 [Serpula lacrymans var. lacrymans S7.9]